MAYCRTGEYPIYFEEAGRGLPVILIHGHALDLRVWDDVVPGLVSAGLRVIRYDVRGHGRSHAPDSGYTWDAYLADLKALVSHLGLQEAVVVGFSMGGGIALSFAQHYPERTAGLALVASVLPGFGYSGAFGREVEQVQAAVRERGVHPAIEEVFPQTSLYAQIRDDADAMDKVHAMLAGYSGKEYLEPEDQRPPYDPQHLRRLGDVDAPTLVVVGSEDNQDMHQIAKLLSERISAAELVSLDGAGHMLPMERPRELSALLATFARTRARSPLRR